MADAATTSGFDAPGSWSWPEDIISGQARERQSSSTNHPNTRSSASTAGSHPQDANERPQKEKHYKPRTCRICLETVQPTYEPPSSSLPSYLAGSPNVTYNSEGGRLIRPCTCKGSQRYVHEDCLSEWRHADPAYGARNFWECPTCGFRYRLSRLGWGKWISSGLSQMMLTIVIFFGAVFLLGFVADPIINTYVDPVGTIASIPYAEEGPRYDRRHWDTRRRQWEQDEQGGWSEHFLKGFASLGVLGFLKMLWASGPIHWLRMGGGGWGGGSRVGSTGRDRVANISWIVLVVGVCTFLFTVWKAVRALSRRFLEKAGERVMDVQDDGDDDNEDEGSD